MTRDRSFAANRLWPIIYLTALLIVILLFIFMFLGFGAASLMGFATEFPRRIGESVMSFFARCKPQELPPPHSSVTAGHHSITSSALATTVGVNSMPSVFAVFRLTINWNLLGR
jgi:hypothetical protein